MNRDGPAAIIALAIPALGSLAVEPLYVLVDTAIVGRLGTAQLGGLALAATVLGARRRRLQLPHLRHDRAGRPPPRRRPAGRRPPTSACRRCGCRRSSASSLAPLVVLGRAARGGLLGGDGDVLDFAVTYLRIAAVGVPFVVFALGAQGVQRGAADYRTPLVILLAVEPRQRRARGAVRVRVRLGRARLGVVDGDRPGRRRRRLRRRRAPPPPPGAATAARAGRGWRRC